MHESPHLTGIRHRQGRLSQLFSLLAGLLLLALGFLFSVVFLAALLVLGGTLWLWLWWKTRSLRRASNDPEFTTSIHAGGESSPQDGYTIEGEATRIGDDDR